MEADQAVEHAVLDQTNVDELRLKNGGYEFIFTHPEACLSTKQGVALFQSDAAQVGRDIANITVLRILYSDCLLRSTSL